MPIQIFFDMDGCLACFERFDKSCIEKAPFFVPGKHYFLQCREDAKLFSVFRRLWETESESLDPGFETHVLTRLYPDNPMEPEWRADKTKWLKLKLPDYPEDRIHFTHAYKGAFLQECLDREDSRPRDKPAVRPYVLIDDQNENLQSWDNLGGIAMKYGNGINNPESWPGIVLYPNYTGEMILNEILNVMRSLGAAPPRDVFG